MNTLVPLRHGAAACLLTLLLGTGAASAQYLAQPLPPAPPSVVVVPGVPPALQDEIIPPAPLQAQVWQPGYWQWTGVQYVWQPGQYVTAPTMAAVWVPGQWVAQGGGWIWQDGHWQ